MRTKIVNRRAKQLAVCVKMRLEEKNVSHISVTKQSRKYAFYSFAKLTKVIIFYWIYAIVVFIRTCVSFFCPIHTVIHTNMFPILT